MKPETDSYNTDVTMGSYKNQPASKTYSDIVSTVIHWKFSSETGARENDHCSSSTSAPGQRTEAGKRQRHEKWNRKTKVSLLAISM